MPDFDRSLPMILHRVLDQIMPAYRELFARHDLTEPQWRILRVLWISGQVTSAELSARTLLTPPNLVGIIDRLEKKELVTRIRSVDDRRIVYVVATTKGRALEEEVIPYVEVIDAGLRGKVSRGDWEEMERSLVKISGATARVPLEDAEEA